MYNEINFVPVYDIDCWHIYDTPICGPNRYMGAEPDEDIEFNVNEPYVICRLSLYITRHNTECLFRASGGIIVICNPDTKHILICNCEMKAFMMTSSNGNIFRVTGPLCGEFTGHRRIPRT